MKDLFGDPVVIAQEKAAKKRRDPKPDGYAWEPGTGPAGETCKTCDHACAVEYAKRYWKCGKNRKAWTKGPGSDIRLKSPACKFWERRQK